MRARLETPFRRFIPTVSEVVRLRGEDGSGLGEAMRLSSRDESDDDGDDERLCGQMPSIGGDEGSGVLGVR